MKNSWSRPISDAVLILLACVAYSNGLSHEWVYDDVPLIADRSVLDDPGALGLLLSTKYGETFGELSYRPIGTLSLFVDSLVLGRVPLRSHALNLALHISLGLLFRRLVFLLYRREGIAWLAAALFLCHPLATEVVNCAGFRREILSAIGVVLTLGLVAKTLSTSSESVARWAYAASGAALVLSLLAKESAIVILALAPLVLARADLPGAVRIRSDPKMRARALKLLSVGCVGVLAWSALYVAFAYTGDAERLGASQGPWLGFLSFSRAFPLYARLWVAPLGLSTQHFFEPVTSYANGGAWIGLAAFTTLAGSSLLAIMAPRERGAHWGIAGTGGLWCCVALAPTFQILPTPQLVAERYVYVPLLGASLLAAALLDALRVALVRRGADLGRSGRASLAAWWLTVGLILTFLIGATSFRNRDWSDDVTLTIRRYELWPENDAYSRTALGVLEGSRGDLVTARRYLARAVSLDPGLPEAHDALEILARTEGNLAEAQAHRRRAATSRAAAARRRALE